MSSRQANSQLEVEFVNASTCTLRLYHRTGFLSTQRKTLKTLTPPSGNNVTVSSFVFRFENSTNEIIDVEYEVENETGGVRRRPVYKPVDIQIDSTILLRYSKISVVDSETRSAEASSRKKFELRTEPRAVQNEAGWVVTVVKKLIIGLPHVFCACVKYVSSRFRNLIPATQPSAPVSEPPVDGADAGGVRRVPAAVSSAINYVGNLKGWTYFRTANRRQDTMPR